MSLEHSEAHASSLELQELADELAEPRSLPPRSSWRRLLIDRLRGYQTPAWLVKHGLRLGHDVYIGDVYFDLGFLWLISVGDGTALTHGVRILAHDAASKHLTGYTRIGRVDIGRRVFVGFGSIILPGVRIGDNSIVGAGSVVRGEVAAGTVVAGNPARSIMTVEEFAAKQRHQIAGRPVYPGEGFAAYRSRVDRETMQRMRRELRDGPGYVQ